MVDSWSAESRIILERELWVAVLKAQKELGIEIEDQVIEDYESVIESVDLNSIRKREKITRHDVKARFSDLPNSLLEDRINRLNNAAREPDIRHQLIQFG